MGNKNRKKIAATLLSVLFLSNQSLTIMAVATEITGVTGNNGVYNINPTAIITGSDMGYRKYKDFDLSQGDIANLIYKYGTKDVSTFVNLVDNKININGIVNSMRDGNFYNGKAVFVSPNGMVVGSSGVINVGSLSVVTPNADTYNYYKANPSSDLSGLYNNVANSSVTINGKVFATNNVDVTTGNINVTGNVLAGTGNNSAITTNSQADALFNNLVNTENIHSASNINSRNGNIKLTSGTGTLISGNMQNLGKGTTEIVNNGQEGITKSGTVENDNNLAITNYGQGGTDIQGTVKNTGTSNVVNKAGLLNIGGSFANKGNATFTNDGTNFNIDGTVANTGGTLSMLNNNGGLNVNSTAVVSNSGTGVTTITNHGTDGLNVSGKISSDGDLTMTNTGAKGINIASSGHVTGNDNNIYVNNNSKGGVNVKGLVNAKNNVNIQYAIGNVVIGDNTANNNYVTAGKNIDIAINNGSLLNYGVEKVLLNAGGDLNMDVTDGTIGLEVGGGCQGAACTGVGPKSGGSRDFTKSVNANVKGKVNAVTTKATKPEDLVINYAAIDSDMNIDSIKADGRVILTVDDDYGKNNTGARYNMVNASTDKTKANVEGKGISLIRSEEH